MKKITSKPFLALFATLLLLAASASAQIFRYYTNGSIWTVTTVKIKAGMDPAYLQYLDGPFKKESDAMVKAGYMKSYKLLRTVDDDSSWNLMILREYKGLADLEANEEKADALLRQVAGDDQAQMKGYEDRSKIREVLGTKTARELMLR
jgi:hypothetical protein